MNTEKAGGADPGATPSEEIKSRPEQRSTWTAAVPPNLSHVLRRTRPLSARFAISAPIG